MPLPHRRRWFELIVRPRRTAERVEDELATHFALLEADLTSQGWTADAASHEARRRFGDVDATRDNLLAIGSGTDRGRRRAEWATDFGTDLRLAIRQARRQPWFTAVAVATLALGLGACVTAFSVIRRVLLAPLPYRDAASLVVLWEHNRPRNSVHNLVGLANYLRWKERSQSFASLAIYTWSGSTLVEGDHPETLIGRAVETSFFQVLGARPTLGRDFVPEDGRPATTRVMILSDELWHRRFGADPSVIGRSIELSDGRAQVIGVMSPAFRPLRDEQYWEPFTIGPNAGNPQGRNSMVVGRLKPSVSIEAARSELAGIAARLEDELPAFDRGWDIEVIGFKDQVVGDARPILLVAAAAILFVLLIAVANVGNLLLGRALTRSGETAVRTALGASRARLGRAWAAEGLLVVGTGIGIGFALAALFLEGLKRMAPAGLPRLGEIGLDPWASAAAALLALGVAALYGLLPLWSLAPQLAAAHSMSAPRTTVGRRSGRLRDGLVVVQVATSLALLIGAGLLFRSLGRLARVDPGIRTEHVLSFGVQLPSPPYDSESRQQAFFDRLSERLRSLPSSVAVGRSAFAPLGGFIAGTSYTVAGTSSEPGQKPSADIATADSGFFAALRVPILAGRAFTSADRNGGQPVVLVNQAFAKLHFPGRDPVGQGVKIDWSHPDLEYRIVGVVGDVRYLGLDRPARAAIYFADGQDMHGYRSYYLRSQQDPMDLAPAVRAAIRELDPRLAVEQLRPLEELARDSMAGRRDPFLLLGALATVAAFLAAVGLFGLLGFLVRQRQREIGIRSALGATRTEIGWLVIRRGLGLATAGTVIGIALAAALARGLRTALFEIGTADPVTYLAGAIGMLLVAMVASALPASRATRIDAAAALKSD